MSDGGKNVFISHVHEDDEVLHGLRELLRNSGHNIRDASIDSTKPNNAKDPNYIKAEILAPRIQWASTLIVLVSAKTHESEWVDWEIEYAHKLGKRIVGVWDQGAQNSDLPEALDKYGDAIVGWQADRVMEAINGKDEAFTVEGTPNATRDIKRYTC